MTPLEAKLWAAIVACANEGRVEDMMWLVRIFEAIQHGDLDAHGCHPLHHLAFNWLAEPAVRPDIACLLTHFGLAL